MALGRTFITAIGEEVNEMGKGALPMDITIRHAEPDDYEAVQRIFAAPKATWGTLHLQAYTDNGPAFRLYEKSGFAVEGTLLQFAIRDGQYVDAYMMARVRES